MVNGTHPEDIELFDYVEGDVSGTRRDELETHLASCASCAEHVARVQASRAALRRTQLLELSPSRRDAILRNLPAQEEADPRRPVPSLKRLLAVLTPVAALAAVIALIVTTGDFSGGGGGGGSATAGAEAGTTSRQAAPAGGGSYDRLLRVAGPADQVAADLRKKGFDARAVGDRVEVRNASKAEVERALGNRRAGKVEIVIVP
jgi:anti-sigma factor RsiW